MSSTLKTFEGNLLENLSSTYKYNNDLNKYTVSYAEGSEGTYVDSSGNVVTIKDDVQNDIIRIRAGDTITNARDGGIGIRLFKWASTNPLKGGKFRLTDVTGNTVKEYTSDANGLVAGETAIVNTVSISEGEALIGAAGAYLRYNSASNQLRFRYYKSAS